jgi:hypothetical protein
MSVSLTVAVAELISAAFYVGSGRGFNSREGPIFLNDLL